MSNSPLAEDAVVEAMLEAYEAAPGLSPYSAMRAALKAADRLRVARPYNPDAADPAYASLAERLSKLSRDTALANHAQLLAQSSAALLDLMHRRDCLAFEMQGLERMRVIDNEYLINQRDRARQALACSEDHLKALVSALERALYSFRLSLASKPVRCADEVIAEAENALRAVGRDDPELKTA